MYGRIIYDEENDENIVKDSFPMTSDDNKLFSKTSWYLRNNVKFNLDAIPIILINLKSDGRKVLAYILTHLKFNTNVITLDRKDVLKYLGIKDNAVISKGIKMLLEEQIIENVEDAPKDTYKVPMNLLVRGNVNTMMSTLEKEKKEKEINERENQNVKSYKELNDVRKFRIKLKKRNGNIESKNQKTSAGS